MLPIAAAPFAGGPAFPDARPERQPARQEAEPPEEYRIGPEDVLRIAVWKNEAMSHVVPVRPDGMISLPLLNDVPAAGMTPEEFRKSLAHRLAEYIPEPEVSVMVVEIRSPKISVVGEVVHPGRFELRSRTTVLDALALAGGLKEFASRDRIFVLRSEDGAQRRIPFDYGKAVANRGVENIPLRAGDIVIVP